MKLSSKPIVVIISVGLATVFCLFVAQHIQRSERPLRLTEAEMAPKVSSYAQDLPPASESLLPAVGDPMANPIRPISLDSDFWKRFFVKGGGTKLPDGPPSFEKSNKASGGDEFKKFYLHKNCSSSLQFNQGELRIGGLTKEDCALAAQISAKEATEALYSAASLGHHQAILELMSLADGQMIKQPNSTQLQELGTKVEEILAKGVNNASISALWASISLYWNGTLVAKNRARALAFAEIFVTLNPSDEELAPFLARQQKTYKKAEIDAINAELTLLKTRMSSRQISSE